MSGWSSVRSLSPPGVRFWSLDSAVAVNSSLSGTGSKGSNGCPGFHASGSGATAGAVNGNGADLDRATAFFFGLGLEVEGRMLMEGEFVDTAIGIPDFRSQI